MSTSTIEQLQNLGLTEKDFNMLIKGIDSIETCAANGDIMNLMVKAMFVKAKPGESDESFYRRVSENDTATLERAKRARHHDIEDAAILKAKIIGLKRILITQAHVDYANNSLRGKPLKD